MRRSWRTSSFLSSLALTQARLEIGEGRLPWRSSLIAEPPEPAGAPHRPPRRSAFAREPRRRQDVRAQVAVLVQMRHLAPKPARAPLRAARSSVSGAWKSQPCAAASQLDADDGRAVLAPSAAAAARHAPPSRRDPPGWPRSGSNRRSPEWRAACSPTPARRPSPAASMKPEFRPGLRRQEGRQAATAPDRSAWRCGARRASRSRTSASAIMSAAKATGSA